jgi:hypothetical protein
MDKYKASKWRWEFMRRNPEYIADYKEMSKLEKKAKHYDEDHVRYHSTAKDEKESSYCKKWEIRKMCDPDKSFDDLFPHIGVDLHDQELSGAERVQKWAMKLYSKHSIDQLGLDQGAINVIHSGGGILPDEDSWIVSFPSNMKDDMSDNDLIISINFNKVNSLKTLQKEVSKLIETYYKAPKMEIVKEKRKAKLKIKKPEKKHQKYDIDYDIIIKVGDWKEKEKKKNQQIARILFPSAFKDTTNEIANPESAIRNVSHYYKRYKELINGGYKNISYP